jgi:chitodextrinase
MTRRFWTCLAAGVSLGVLLPAIPAAAGRDRTPPTTPANLRITATTATTISLAWNASTDNSSNFWYCVQTNGDGCIRVNPPQTTFTRSQLLPERTHTFAVYALDAAGNRSANSNTVSYTTPPDTRPPSPPPVLSTTAVAPTTISLTWTPSLDDISQVWTSLFVDGSAVFVDRLGPPNFTLPELTPETTYEFKVTVRDASGNVAESNDLAVTTPAVTDMQPPTAPTGLRRLSTGDPLDVLLQWIQSIDETDRQSAIRYQIFFDGVLNGSVLGSSRAWTTCIGLGPTEVFLLAVDTSGNVSTPSNTITIDCTAL